jgi:hypothetical protein
LDRESKELERRRDGTPLTGKHLVTNGDDSLRGTISARG